MRQRDQIGAAALLDLFGTGGLAKQQHRRRDRLAMHRGPDMRAQSRQSRSREWSWRKGFNRGAPLRINKVVWLIR